MTDQSKKVREILDNLQSVATLTPRELLLENRESLLSARAKRVTPKQISDALTQGGVKVSENAVKAALREIADTKSKTSTKPTTNKNAVKRKTSDNTIPKKIGGGS